MLDGAAESDRGLSVGRVFPEGLDRALELQAAAHELGQGALVIFARAHDVYGGEIPAQGAARSGAQGREIALALQLVHGDAAVEFRPPRLGSVCRRTAVDVALPEAVGRGRYAEDARAGAAAQDGADDIPVDRADVLRTEPVALVYDYDVHTRQLAEMVVHGLGRAHDNTRVRVAGFGDGGAHKAHAGLHAGSFPALQKLVHGLAHEDGAVGQNEAAHVPVLIIITRQGAEHNGLAGARGRLQQKELVGKGAARQRAESAALIGAEREHAEGIFQAGKDKKFFSRRTGLISEG